MSDTKQRLLHGTLAAIGTHGIAGISARTIASAAGVNQALVFYHFGSVDELLAAACTANTADRVATYSARFAEVRTLRELLDVGRALHEQEKELGHVSVLAQLLAGAQTDRRLAESVAAALKLWVDEIESVLRRLLVNSPSRRSPTSAGWPGRSPGHSSASNSTREWTRRGPAGRSSLSNSSPC
ncbi:hypothetical protein GCM10027615_19710 [Plantactinospora veratri]